MTLGSSRTILVMGTAFVCLLGARLAGGQAAQEQAPMAETVFKNVQVLKGISVDEFMGTMGVFSAALGMSCEDCHASDDSNWENYAKDVSPRKNVARRMVTMMAAINKEHFQGRQVVTCYSCHRGSNRPKVTPNLANLYGAPPPDEPDDVILGPALGAPSPDQVLDKYIQALGGADKLAGLKSFVAKGMSLGYGPEGERPIEVYAKAPNQRTTIIHTGNGDNSAVFDGQRGWTAVPLKPVDVVPLTRHDLDGARIEAMLSFPGQIKQVLTRMRPGPATTIDDRRVNVIQGTGSGGALATLYFDEETGLLVRFMRYADSPVGRFPTQIDYSEYKEVSGVKMPVKWTLTWLDGREEVTLSDIQPNAPIDEAKFAKPAAPKAP